MNGKVLLKQGEKSTRDHNPPHSWRLSHVELVKYNWHMVSSAAFAPFLSHFYTGGCWPRGGRTIVGFTAPCSAIELVIKVYKGNRMGRIPTATFPKNPTISNQWDIGQGRWGQSAWLFSSCLGTAKLLQTQLLKTNLEGTFLQFPWNWFYSSDFSDGLKSNDILSIIGAAGTTWEDTMWKLNGRWQKQLSRCSEATLPSPTSAALHKQVSISCAETPESKSVNLALLYFLIDSDLFIAFISKGRLRCVISDISVLVESDLCHCWCISCPQHSVCPFTVVFWDASMHGDRGDIYQ